MLLKLRRLNGGSEDTIGAISIDCEFECFSLEDEYRTKKVYGETRIPSGHYEIKLRTEGGFHERYKEVYGDMHKGMLWLQDVPGFEYILIHTGNTDDDTAGCILVGDSCDNNVGDDVGSVGHSRMAYKRLYPKVADAILSGEKVHITIYDEGQWMD